MKLDSSFFVRLYCFFADSCLQLKLEEEEKQRNMASLRSKRLQQKFSEIAEREGPQLRSVIRSGSLGEVDICRNSSPQVKPVLQHSLSLCGKHDYQNKGVVYR